MEQKDEYLQLSACSIFPFAGCQWALIHIENQWSENLRTIEGNLFHNRAHDEQRRERRGDTLILRGLPIVSHTLRLSGQCDVLEFHASPKGVHLRGEGRAFGFLFRWNTSVAHPKKILQTNCSSAPKPSAWKRCFAVPFRREHYFTANPAENSGIVYGRTAGKGAAYYCGNAPNVPAPATLQK